MIESINHSPQTNSALSSNCSLLSNVFSSIISRSGSMMALEYSDDEVSVPTSNRSETAPPAKKARSSSAVVNTIRSSSTKKRVNKITPVTPQQKPTPYELFGTDSEEETEEPRGRKHGNDYDLTSYFTIRCLKAYSRQVQTIETGIYYIITKIYNANHIAHPDIVIKIRLSPDTKEWYHIVKFIETSRRQIRNCFIFSCLKDDRPFIRSIISPDRSREVSQKLHRRSEENRSQKEHLPTATTSVAMKHRSPSAPASVASTSRKSSARDVFGSDSDEDAVNVQPGKKNLPLCSYFSKRISHGVSRQSDQNKAGTHYVELKVYNCDEIKHIQPMNRWRHSIITVKNRTDDNTEAWKHLTEFIKATRREFKDCRPDIINGC